MQGTGSGIVALQRLRNRRAPCEMYARAWYSWQAVEQQTENHLRLS